MRRFRMPTIPRMGLPSSHVGDEELQAYDSEIFADAEEEYSPPEKRPSAPYMSGLRRRDIYQEETRYEDAYQNESPIKKHSSGTTRMKTLTSLAYHEEDIVPVERSEDTHSTEKEDKVQIQNQERGEGLSKHTNVPVLWREEAPAPAIASPFAHADTPNQTQRYLSNDTNVRPRRRVLWNELRKPAQTVNETVTKIRNRLPHDALLEFKRKAQEGLAFLVAHIFALFSFLKWMSLTVFRFLIGSIVFQPAQRANTAGSSGADRSEEDRKDNEMNLTARSTSEAKDEVEKISQANTILKGCKSSPQKQPSVVMHDKTTGTSGPEVMGRATDRVTTVSRSPLCLRTAEEMQEDEQVEEHHGNKTCIAPTSSKLDSGSRRHFRMNNGVNGVNFNAESHADFSGLEPFNGAPSQGWNLSEDKMKYLDQKNLSFEHSESEIILSPLESTAPAFDSDGQSSDGDMNRANNLRGQTGASERPGRLSSEMNEAVRLRGKNKSSRGSTGKLKSDVRTMKESLLRVLGRNKIEPETRFTSPRSAPKTLALVADILVKEYECDVAVRRNGALKIRCEKPFSGNRRVRVRLAFQPITAFSCNVIVSRSREDDLQVSTMDYVSFVTDLQRSFLNATSEGMQGIHSG